MEALLQYYQVIKLFDGAGWIQLHVEWWLHTQVARFFLPGTAIGGVDFVEDIYLEKMRSCEKVLYSMKNIGCNPYKLHPLTVRFIYKQYCQSILKFGFQFVQLRRSFLSMLDVRQNILLKNILSAHHRARFKVVLNEIKVEQVSLLYARHMVFGWKQCVNT